MLAAGSRAFILDHDDAGVRTPPRQLERARSKHGLTKSAFLAWPLILARDRFKAAIHYRFSACLPEHVGVIFHGLNDLIHEVLIVDANVPGGMQSTYPRLGMFLWTDDNLHQRRD